MIAGWNRRDARRLALVAVCVFAGWAQVSSAQIVKAPRYQGGVDAPVPQLNLPPLPPALTPHGTVVEDVVARINDQIISRSDVERSEQQLQQEAAQNNVPASELAVKQRDMLRDMIDQQLLLSKAKELGLNADAEVIRRLDDIRKQNKMDSLDDLEKAAKQQGVSFEDFKAQIRNQILTQEVVRDEVGRRLQMSQADENKYYEAHKAEFTQPEQIKLSEILVPLPDTASTTEVAQAEAKAKDLKAKVDAGQDFGDLARKNSGGPSAAQGGELGLFKRGALAKVLEDQTFSLQPGQSTEPIRTRQGFVILKVTEHQLAGPAPIKDVEPQIQEAIYMQQMQPALRTYLTKLREESYVDLQPGFVDSGASSAETKPVFTAYAPPPVKKKKVKAKARFYRNGAAVASNKPVVASPDTTGTRTITGPEGKAAVDPSTGLAVMPATTLAKNGSPKKVKKEKVRFGQAPRNALPEGTEDAVSTPEAAGTSAATPTAAAGSTAEARTPLTATSTAGAATEVANSSDLADNPLAPHAPEAKKTRFAARAKEEKEKKVKVVSAKQQEKIAATPVAMSSEEKAAAQTQAAPLGLAGDSPRKPKKPKKVKGAPKERLADKAPTPKPVEQPIDQTASPALAPTGIAPSSSTPERATPDTIAPASPVNSSVPRSVPNQPDTTLPPVTQPVPGSPQTGQPVPQPQL